MSVNLENAFVDHENFNMEMIQLLVIGAFFHLFFCPYTKVEESFNLQAMHDILYLRLNLSQYDHKEFPGVVPRTFIGPLFVSLLSSPVVALFSLLGLCKFWSQYVVRGVLALCVLFPFFKFTRSLESQFGKSFTRWYLMVTASQYHFMYYLSRPLPNIMAMPLVLLALHSWLRRRHTNFIIYSGASIIWFRGELAIFFGTILLFELFYGSLTLSRLVKVAAPAGLLLLLVTVAVDSVFWGKWLWPEGEVLWFNTVLNKSGEWGTSPFLWYFYSAIPRAMAFSVFLLPLGIFYSSRVTKIVLPGLIFVFLYSFLPHKELRFIIYAFPLFNVAVAASCHAAWENRRKSKIQKFLALCFAAHLLFNCFFTGFLLMIARVNYPGGVAIARLHRLAHPKEDVFIHIDNLSAQTGVSRFTQINPNWRYSKEENLKPGSGELFEFTHLLVEAKSKYSVNLKPYQKTHDILESVEGFSQVALNYKMFPPFQIKTKPMLFILKRKHSEPPSPDYKSYTSPKKITLESDHLESDKDEKEEDDEANERDWEEETIRYEPEEKESNPQEAVEPDENKGLRDIEEYGILEEETISEIKQLDQDPAKNDEELRRTREKIKEILKEYKQGGIAAPEKSDKTSETTETGSQIEKRSIVKEETAKSGNSILETSSSTFGNFKEENLDVLESAKMKSKGLEKPKKKVKKDASE